MTPYAASFARALPRLALAAAILASALSCEKQPASPSSSAPPAEKESEKQLRIAVVPKGTTHEFWRTVQAGAARAASDLGVQMTFRGPEREDDRAQQISLVQNLIGSGRYDAIVLAPLDNRALVGPVKEAKAANIPVVIFDSGLDPRAGASASAPCGRAARPPGPASRRGRGPSAPGGWGSGHRRPPSHGSRSRGRGEGTWSAWRGGWPPASRRSIQTTPEQGATLPTRTSVRATRGVPGDPP